MRSSKETKLIAQGYFHPNLPPVCRIQARWVVRIMHGTGAEGLRIQPGK